MEDGGTALAPGDRALAALLRAHGLAMNGGVLHAAELLSENELTDAQNGYQFFAFPAVAGLLSRARNLFNDGHELDRYECELDAEYMQHTPDDSALFQKFEQHFSSHPTGFAPL